tara:strand:- start:50511 stop:53891 length:3381 start_codon:yes stop_codon:yes gene_type:complete
MKTKVLCSFIFILPLICISCKKDFGDVQTGTNKTTLFTFLPESRTNIDFKNELTYTEDFNTYTYRNFYNGGGVAIADINNDGLQDLFFTGGMVSNKLYLNQGDFEFKDVTDESGLNSLGVWSTGVSFADVNGDGLLDIYICKSGKPEGERRNNELFINRGLDKTGTYPVFHEMAKEYGIADYGFSTHAVFFDYDKDGDLDMYLLNNSIKSIGNYDLKKDRRLIRDPYGGNKLYRNDGAVFADVSEQAGIYGSTIGFGLGVTIGDLNKDGWQDIFVSNDYFEKDYLYINNKDGTFTEDLEGSIGEISLGSMGADMADINNDGFPEIFVTEMLPKEEARLKTKAIFEDWNKYQANMKAGYYRQFPRNVLQLNRGYKDEGDNIFMSEISRFSGVEATDWSWGALIADLDNDGLKDIFVANGIYKDLIDLDYLNFYADPITARRLFEERGSFLKQLIDSIPSTPLPNFAYRNNGDLTFTDETINWGFEKPTFSNGSAYADLDNDGDLDLVMNNVNMPASVYRNNAETLRPEHHFLTIALKGTEKNTFAMGSQVTVYQDGKELYQELAPMRGYQSSVDYRLHFGLGINPKVDSIRIQWPDLSVEIEKDVQVDQIISFAQQLNENAIPIVQSHRSVGKGIFNLENDNKGLAYYYKKSNFNDFDRNPLLFHMQSAEGTKMSIADVDNDDRADIYIGGAKGETGVLFVQNNKGNFTIKPQLSFENDKSSMDAGSCFFDADNDGDLDLYVCSGGNEFPSTSSSLKDRLYFNQGNGNYVLSGQNLPTNFYENSSCVIAADIDKDGDQDLFVGTRSKSFDYGMPVNGYILINDGKGQFANKTELLAPELFGIGMITDAKWFDHDNDGDEDLVVVGDWMPVTIFQNNGGSFVNITPEVGLEHSNGFWNVIEIADLDSDGYLDLVVGNHGLNSRFKASPNKPVRMYLNDFDANGKTEHIITTFKGENEYPLIGKTDLVSQLPYLKKKYLKFKSYREQTVEDIFGPELVQKSSIREVYNTATTCYLYRRGKYEEQKLPSEAQFSPVYALEVFDYDLDGNLDILLVGNFHWSKPEVGIYDGNRALFLRGDGNGGFSALGSSQSGLFVEGEVRDVKSIIAGHERVTVFLKINDSLSILGHQK